MRLRQRETAECGAARKRRQPPRLLLVGAECLDTAHHETALYRHAAAQAAVAALELLANQAIARIAQTAAAISRERRAEQPELRQARNELDWETLGGKALVDDG